MCKTLDNHKLPVFLNCKTTPLSQKICKYALYERDFVALSESQPTPATLLHIKQDHPYCWLSCSGSWHSVKSWQKADWWHKHMYDQEYQPA